MARATKKTTKAPATKATKGKAQPAPATPFEIPVIIGFSVDANGDPRLTSLWLKGFGWVVGGAKTSAVHCTASLRVLPERDSQPFVKDAAAAFEQVKAAFVNYNYHARRGRLFPVGGEEVAP